MSVVIIEANGNIGSYLLEKAPSLIDFDLAHSDMFSSDCLSKVYTNIILAEFSPPDICTREHELAWAVNLTGTAVPCIYLPLEDFEIETNNTNTLL